MCFSKLYKMFSREKTKLRLTQSHLNAIGDSIAGNHWWKDKNGRYLGCNKTIAKLIGLKAPEEIIGKTDFDMPWANQAKDLIENDNLVMSSKTAMSFEEFAETSAGTVYLLTTKVPLFDEAGNVIGTVGTSMDITELKETQKKLEDAKIENETQKVLIEQEEKFRKLAYQVVHDVQSPLTTLSTIANSAAGLPENQRVDLRRSVTTIRDITRHLLEQYKKKEIDDGSIEEREAVLVSILLSEVLTAKRYQYKSLPIQFNAHINQDAQFSFIRVQKNYFERMLSNLINNAVDAFEDNLGEVTIGLSVDDEWVRIVIQDNGKGMPTELVNKILNKEAFTSGKAAGHGIGFGQIWETLENNYGELDIDSTSGKGTTMTLTFSRIQVPTWCVDEIILKEKDRVIILDDDPSIHGAWDLRFESVAKENHDIAIHHFQQGSEALAFINGQTPEEKDHIFLLSDYELIGQDKNGLEVIAATGLKRAILVTSHYVEHDIQNRATEMKIRILPKSLAPEVPITVLETTADMADADTIILDDNESFARSVATFVFTKSKVDQYHQPEELLRNIHRYALDTRIFLDNNFDNSFLKGIDIAETLHERGFSRLYLVSGEVFEPGEIPAYLTVVSKENIENMQES